MVWLVDPMDYTNGIYFHTKFFTKFNEFKVIIKIIIVFLNLTLDTGIQEKFNFRLILYFRNN